MTDTQIYILIGVPMLFNALLIMLVIGIMNAKFSALEEKFKSIYQRFDQINQRFDDMRDLWRSELHRVEEVLDARLKQLEQSR